MPSLHMLFVDDEPTIRITLPEILRLHGHQVETASTVAEALAAINSRRFDVLISDLNIGSPGDGFTVVSAMRRTQPDCVTLILTGYPGFETALQAIRNQVDDYLVKPTKVERLVDTIETKLKDRKPHAPPPIRRVGEIMRVHEDDIVHRTLEELAARRASGNGDFAGALISLLREVADSVNKRLLSTRLIWAEEHGKLRRSQGYTLNDLFNEFRAFERIVYEVIQENLLGADVSNLVPDLRLFNDQVQDVMQHAVNAFLEEKVAA
jgi:YesN/AraC family two-component response regulator